MIRRGRVRSRVPRWALVGVAALVLAGLLAVPLGGFDTVSRSAAGAEQLEPGQRHLADRFDTTLQRAQVLPQKVGSSLDPEPGTAYLTVFGIFENRTEKTQLAVRDLLYIDGLGEPTTVVMVDDQSGLPELQPGLPVALAYVWELDEDAVVAGDALEVVVVDRTETDSKAGTGTIWLDPRAGAEVRVDVT